MSWFRTPKGVLFLCPDSENHRYYARFWPTRWVGILKTKCAIIVVSSRKYLLTAVLYEAIASACTTAFPLPDEALPEATPKKNGDYMTKPEKEMWRINIENAAATVAEQYGNEVVESVFRRYDAQGLYDLSPCYFSEVFGDLELIVNDN